jgi:hypothetical protein
MSDELNAEDNSTEQAVNTDSAPSAESTESAPVDNQTTPAQPPIGEQPTQGKPDNKSIPYDRFKEVIEQKNQKDSHIKELEQRLAQLEGAFKPSQEEKANKAVEKLVSAGVDPQVAKLLASTMEDVATERVEQRVNPVEQRNALMEVNSWVRDFAQSHKDYDELNPDMQKVFEAMPPQMQNLVVSDRLGLEMLYQYVKGVRSSQTVSQAKQEGRNEAYANQQLKAAMSGTPNSAPTPKGVPTEAEIHAMSPKEYQDLVAKFPGGVNALIAKMAGAQ